MIEIKKTINLILIFLLLVFVIQTSSSFAAERLISKEQLLTPERITREQVLQLEKMTKEQFEKLPDTAVIDVKGRQITKGQYMSEMNQKAKQDLEKARAELSRKAQADFEAARAKFLQGEKAKLDANNAKVNAEIERLRQKNTESSSRLLSIQNEANQLNTRFRTANPSEKAQIEKRAGELLQQIKQMGY